jgi:hypothetical protein
VEKVDFRKACLDKGHKKTDRTSTNDYFETSKRGFLIMFGHRLKYTCVPPSVAVALSRVRAISRRQSRIDCENADFSG